MTESGTTEQQAEKPDVHSFGERLYAARTRQGLSAEDVAAAVNLTVDIVEAIERSDIERLPQPAFVQGYIRVLARQLGVPEDVVLEEYSRAVPHKLEAELRPRSVLPDEANSGNPFVKMVSVFLLIAVVLAAIYGFYSYYSEMADTMSTQREDEASNELDLPSRDVAVVDDTGDFGPGLAAEPPQPLVDSEAEVEVVDVTEEAAADSAEAEPEPAVVEDAAAVTVVELPESPPLVEGEDVIVLAANQPSWVEVVDATGSKLYYNLLQEGRSTVLRGKAPFDVFLGNAPVMVVRLNDILIDMTKYVRSNNIAHLTVSEEDGQVVFH